MNAVGKLVGQSIPAACILLSALVMGACANGPDKSASQAPALVDLEWLLGDWQADAGKEIIYEQWRRQDAVSFAGTGSNESRETGERKEFERLQIISKGAKIFFVATVAHNPAPVAFELQNPKSNNLVFSNPEHDFPKMIVYERLDDSRLRVTVSDGGDKGFTLNFVRSGN